MSSLIHDILGQVPRNKKKQRIGRGEGSKGKTSGRGQKGAGARGGKPKRLGFEGGQTEIYRRFPQRGFTNALFTTRYHAVNVSMLDRFEEGATVDQAALKTAGLIPNTRLGVKILGHGELSKKLDVRVAAYSRNAHKLITDAGGTARTETGEEYSFKKPKNARLSRKLDKRLDRLGLAAQADSAELQQGSEQSESKGDGAPSSQPDGSDANVTDAPESGTKPSEGSTGGESDQSQSPTEAPESGDKE